MTVSWEREAELAIRAVSAGAEVLADRPEALPTSRKESLRDVVTELDFLVERRMVSVLAESSHPIIAEESFGGDDRPLEHGPAWVVDPIDGTVNFVAGIPHYAISAGLLVGGQPVCGAVLLPASRELFFTHGDAGAFVNGRAMTVKQAAFEDALVSASFAGRKGHETARRKGYDVFAEVNDRCRGCLRLGSASVAICLVAASRLQGAYGFGVRIWDVGAALAIAMQAGCDVFLERRGTEVDFVVGTTAVVRAVVDIARERGLVPR
jgi:myo-inositol-1(or 4)-monophosphatase